MNILEPSLDMLMTKVDSKYALVVAAAKRGRQITEADDKVTTAVGHKAVTRAMQEIGRGQISILEPEKPIDPMLESSLRR